MAYVEGLYWPQQEAAAPFGTAAYVFHTGGHRDRRDTQCDRALLQQAQNAQLVATRHDKSVDSYLGFIQLVSIQLVMRRLVNPP